MPKMNKDRFLAYESLRNLECNDLEELGIIIHWTGKCLETTLGIKYSDMLKSNDPNVQICKYAFELLRQASDMVEQAGQNIGGY